MAFEGLLEEHAAIRRQIGDLLGRSIGRAACAELAASLDRHFRREEEDLLPLVTPFLPTSTGPVSVVLEEHREIRELAEILAVRPDEAVVKRLSELLPPHFAKEEDLILPFAESHLSPQDLARFGPKGGLVSAPAAFDSLADLYDLLVDWEKRLPREIAFLDDRLRREGARTLLDAACGTGAHLAALSERGYLVSGSDIAADMVERARERCGADVPLHVADFAHAPEVVEERDAVLVIGNSLPNAGSEQAVREALEALRRAVRPGGVLILHMLNYPALVLEGGGLRPLRRVTADGREHLFLKLFEVHRSKVVLNVIAIVREESAYSTRHLRSTLFPVSLPWLAEVFEDLGLELVEATNGFSEEPYEERGSADLLVVARRKELAP